jgi:predicted nucleic acid-binding protein
MKDEVLIDSDVLIWYLRGKPGLTEEIQRLIENNGLYSTPVTVTEIFAGSRPSESKLISHVFNLIQVVEINYDMGKLAGEFLNKYRKSHGLELADSMIGAATSYYELKLWTYNYKHYPMLSEKQFFLF